MNPNKVQARKMVLVGVFALAIISIYRERQDASTEGTFRIMWGVGVVGMFLSLLADFVPTIAGPFAALIVLGSLTHGGTDVLTKALGLIAVAPTSGGSGATGPGSKAPTVVTRDKQGNPAIVVDPVTGRKRAVQPAPAG